MKNSWPTNPSSKTQGVHYGAKKLGEVCNIAYGFAFKAVDFNEAGKGLSVIPKQKAGVSRTLDSPPFVISSVA